MRVVADTNTIVSGLLWKADLVVSGDKRVRNLKTYHGIRIVNVNEALALIPKP